MGWGCDCYPFPFQQGEVQSAKRPADFAALEAQERKLGHGNRKEVPARGSDPERTNNSLVKRKGASSNSASLHLSFTNGLTCLPILPSPLSQRATPTSWRESACGDNNLSTPAGDRGLEGVGTQFLHRPGTPLNGPRRKGGGRSAPDADRGLKAGLGEQHSQGLTCSSFRFQWWPFGGRGEVTRGWG